MNRKMWIAACLMVLPILAQEGYSDPVLAARTIKVIGRKSVTVTTPELKLGDLAEITSTSSSDDEAVIGLQKIFIAESPQPGSETTISATSLLERVRTEGVDLSRVGYTFPRILTVKRAGRQITKEEVKAAIEAVLQISDKEVAIKDVRYKEDKFISPGELKLEAIPLVSQQPGTRAFTIKASAEGSEAQTFQVAAQVDEWGMMPTAKRAISRGAVIEPEDVTMARLNLATLPSDVVREDREIIGLEASRDIGFGEIFRKDKLSIPPLVTAGSRVTMMYKNGLFEATATGIALESGIRGQEIRIRNEASKKVISGTVMEPGLVGVKP